MIITANAEWRAKDSKGWKKTYYIKEVRKQTDQIMSITPQTRLERLSKSEDRWPCLDCRKSVKRVWIYVKEFCEWVIKQPAFETTSIIIIILNCVTLAMEDPTAEEVSALDTAFENIFQGLYTVEMLFKIIGLGFVTGPHPYMCDPWNILDFIIVMSAYLTIFQDLLPKEEVAVQS